MSGVIHKAGLFAFLRFMLLIGKPEEWMGWTVLVFGAASAFFGVLYTSTQRDLKRLLGYSSTENVGIAAMGFGVGCLGLDVGDPGARRRAGFAGGLLHILNHALFKCLLFYAAGAVYRATHTVDLERLGGLAAPAADDGGGSSCSAASRSPRCRRSTASSASSSSTRGSCRARRRRRRRTSRSSCAAALLAFVGAVSALSIARAFGVAFLGSPRDASVHVARPTPRTMTVPMALHAAGIVRRRALPRARASRVDTGPAALFSVAGRRAAHAGVSSRC